MKLSKETKDLIVLSIFLAAVISAIAVLGSFVVLALDPEADLSSVPAIWTVFMIFVIINFANDYFWYHTSLGRMAMKEMTRVVREIPRGIARSLRNLTRR